MPPLKYYPKASGFILVYARGQIQEFRAPHRFHRVRFSRPATRMAGTLPAVLEFWDIL
jgi:hypothetical protein